MLDNKARSMISHRTAKLTHIRSCMCFSHPRITINTGSVVFLVQSLSFQREGGKGELFRLRHGHEFSQQAENWHYQETWLTPGLQLFNSRKKRRSHQRQHKFNKCRIHQRLYRSNKGKTHLLKHKVKGREICPCPRKKNLR